GCDTSIFKGHLGIGMEVSRVIAVFTEEEAELHRETTRVCCPDQLLRVGPYPVLEAGFVGICGLIQYGALRTDGTAAVFSCALPMGTCLSRKFHSEIIINVLSVFISINECFAICSLMASWNLRFIAFCARR